LVINEESGLGFLLGKTALKAKNKIRQSPLFVISLLLLSIVCTIGFHPCSTQSTQITVPDQYSTIQEAIYSALGWNKTYGGAGSDVALALAQTVDGGYALAGRTYSFGAGSSDIWLVKTDAFGNRLWSRTYGGTNLDGVFAFVQTVDGGYALAGHTYSFGAGSSDAWLVKTSADGTPEWNETYGGIDEDLASRLVQTSDEGYVLAGSTKSFGAGSDDFWLVKTAREVSTIIVPDDYSTIQEAINAANPGDTIFVKSGLYYEHIVVNKTVQLVGENPSTTIIDGNLTSTVVRVTSSNVNITRFTIQRSGNVQMPALDAGICLNGTAGCTISDNRVIYNDFFAISLLYSQQNTITYNNMSSVGWGGIHLMSSSRNVVSGNLIDSKYGGINGHVSSNYNNITENVISNCTHGGFWHASTYNNVLRNNISTVAVYGIWLQDQVSYNTVAENNLINCSVAIRVQGPNSNNILSRNVITGAEYGIKIESNARYTRIVDNIIVDNRAGNDSWSAGIRLDSGPDSQIRSNTITGNKYGVLLYSYSPRVSIYNNTIAGNEFGIRVASGGSSYLNVSDNVVMNNRGYGVGVTGFSSGSHYASITRNIIVNNSDGIALGQYSNHNTISQNNISRNGYGFYIEYSTQNTIWGNNIVDNDQQVYLASGSANTWDNDYPTGGNYWSDYSGVDEFCGVGQNITGRDAIGDTPYIINVTNRDDYPLTKPFGIPHDIGITNTTPQKTVIGQGFCTDVYVRIVNYGVNAETFNITVYANTTTIATFADVFLPGHNTTTLSLTWYTTSLRAGNYTLEAVATVVAGETCTTDNACNSTIRITIPGDVDGDFFVNITDAALIGAYWMQTVPPAPANVDINGDGIISIKDATLVGLNWLKHA